MTKTNVIYLKGDIPIKIINEPYCKKCMSPYNDNSTSCYTCSNPPFDNDEWYFNEVKALGIYRNYEKKIPVNILTEVINILKFRKEKTSKRYAGDLIADGLFKLSKTYPELIDDTDYITIIPKFNTTEVNQCDFILLPLIKKFKASGFEIQDISSKVVRLRDIGEHKYKKLFERFDDIKGIHRVDISNLKKSKVLIIDDIYTTGSTTWDLARALKEKNAGEINILVAGRNFGYENWPTFKDLSFDDLLLYFSYLDLHRNRNKITNVEIKSLSIDENNNVHSLLEGTTRDYQLFIDFDNKTLRHDCTDFLIERKGRKRFCKHITKVFFQIKENYGLDKSYKLLSLIYHHLDKWDFENLL